MITNVTDTRFDSIGALILHQHTSPTLSPNPPNFSAYLGIVWTQGPQPLSEKDGNHCSALASLHAQSCDIRVLYRDSDHGCVLV
jgi:hypothetical protein